MTKKDTGRAPTASIPPFGLRMQAELKEAIEKAAHESGRSMNAEIVARLEQSLGLAKGESGKLLEALSQQNIDLSAIEERLDKYLAQFAHQKEQRARQDQAVIGMLGLAVLSHDRAYTDNMINMAIKLLGGEEVTPNTPR